MYSSHHSLLPSVTHSLNRHTLLSFLILQSPLCISSSCPLLFCPFKELQQWKTKIWEWKGKCISLRKKEPYLSLRGRSINSLLLLQCMHVCVAQCWTLSGVQAAWKRAWGISITQRWAQWTVKLYRRTHMYTQYQYISYNTGWSKCGQTHKLTGQTNHSWFSQLQGERLCVRDEHVTRSRLSTGVASTVDSCCVWACQLRI